MYYYRPDVEAGDIFLSYSNAFVSKGIKYIQEWQAKDDEASYSHAGIILDSAGNTFESLSTVTSNCLFKKYAKSKVAIYRPTRWNDKVRERKIQEGISRVLKHDGDQYPYRRLFFHAIGLAKHIHWMNQLVCSELVAKYLYYAGMRHRHYFGTNPDDLHDELKDSKYFELTYEGKLPWKTPLKKLKGKVYGKK